jgi:endonuclease I
MKKIILAMCFLAAHSVFFAQTVLTPGSVVVIGYNYDDPDQVKFVPLVDIAAGTILKFTDNGWNGTSLTTTEGTDTWTASSNIAKGTVQTLNSTSMAFSTSGDQIFIYQGAASAPSFVFGLSTKSWVTGSIASTTSRKPASLVTGTSCIAFTTERDNGRYNVVNSTGTVESMRTAICTASNWTLTDTRISAFPAWTFALGGSSSNEPAANPTGLVFSNVKSYSYQIGFTSTVADGYLMVRSIGFPTTAAPVDGATYQRGDAIGNGKVLSAGTATTFFVEGTKASELNFIQVYAYTGSGAAINYRQVAPLTGSVQTSATGEGTYYSGIDPNTSTFIANLQNRIRTPHVKVAYDQYDETMIAHFAVRDTTANQRVASCVYSGQLYNYTAPFAWYTVSPFSREHSWCVSWTPTNATSGDFEYCDQHHLFPVNQNSANAVRSNHPLGEVVTVTSSFLDGKYGLDAQGNLVYEPKDSHKGDAARALLYMSLRYDGLNGADWTFDYLNNVTLIGLGEDPQDINLLLTWHAQDAPDNYEIARNDYVASIQSNRNPFVDHPEWTQRIAFGDLSYVPVAAMQAPSNASTTVLEETTKMEVYPNPTSGAGYVAIDSEVEQSVRLLITDMQGRMVSDQTLALQSGVQTIELQTEEWPAGLYLAHLVSAQGHSSVKWMIE